MANNNDEKESPVNFKDTLNLPRTDFPIRPSAAENDPKMVARWERDKLYDASYEVHEGAQKFILHDGPPYANGHIHLGHAYNKILKDIVTKYHRMMGRHVPVTPGWDCHGLPIELRVTKEHPGLSPQELKKACRASAAHWMNVQREEFKRLGVVMDWNHPYATMDRNYEAQIMRAFGEFVHKGYIERKNKSVPWCPTDQTVLAAAEIEYKERKDPSVYALFPLSQEATEFLVPKLAGHQLNLAVWTTTPWTLPLNRAVLAHPDEMYDVRKHNDTYFVVGHTAGKKLDELLGGTTDIVAQIPAQKFKGVRVHHPFINELVVPILFDTSVERDSGTAFVHIAPGAGPIDYEIGVKNNLEIFAPVGPDGVYQKGIQPAELEGLSVQDGQGWVINKLTERGRLLLKKTITHSYPHCWRCHNGLIFRATRQWFIDLAHDDLQNKAVVAVEKAIQFTPEQGRNFLRATVSSRWEWCISRQRTWGVPIPALICKQCDQEYSNTELIEQVAQGVEREGIEYWDSVSVDELLPKGTVCSVCESAQFKKEYDILDVWFESGVSHYVVLYKAHEPNLFPADLYLEGIDQHRAWFQSSLLTSLVLEGEPAMKRIMTHGFTVDARGQKMSKSIGNVVAPQEVIDRYGTDVLRLWVASIDNEGDAIVSETVFNNVAEVFRKIRNTLRFLLSNLYDFNAERDALAVEQLLPLDQYSLERLYELQHAVFYYYGKGQFTGVFNELGEYVAAELSSLYLDIIKDRLYVEKADGFKRRSAQTACWYILDTLMRLIAPVMSFTAEAVSDYAQPVKNVSIHLQEFASLHTVEQVLVKPSPEKQTSNDKRALMIGTRSPVWSTLKDIRSAVLKAIEKLREQDIVKHSLETRVVLFIDTTIQELAPLQEFFASLRDRDIDVQEFFKEFLIVSQLKLRDEQADLRPTGIDGLWISVEHASGTKCPRCWHWDETTHEHNLCSRCQRVLGLI